MVESYLLAAAYGWLIGHAGFVGFLLLSFVVESRKGSISARATAVVLALLIIPGLLTFGWALQRYGALQGGGPIVLLGILALLALGLCVASLKTARRESHSS